MGLSTLPPDECPRYKLSAHGAPRLTEAELLAIVLGRGPARNSTEICRALLIRFGGLRGLLRAPPGELAAEVGLGPAGVARLQVIPELAARFLAEKLPHGPALASPGDASRFLALRLRDRPYETFCCLFLDNRHRVIRLAELFRGTIDGTSVYPREVVRSALACHAAAVIAAHNHPSGVAEPSQADERITQRLRRALDLVDIRLIDHLIIGDGITTSLAARGLL